MHYHKIRIMKQIVTCIVALLSANYLMGQSAVNTSIFPTTNSTATTSFTAIKSTQAASYKLSIGGATKIFGTGTIGSLNSPTLIIGNTTAGSRRYGLFVANNGDFQLYDSLTTPAIRLHISGVSSPVNTLGNIGIGVTSPTAALHLKAGIATANFAPLKFTSGVNLTTAEAGAMEYDGTNLYFTPTTARKTIAYADLSNITGTLPVGNGGTGLSALGTANQQLRVNAGGTALEYFTPSGGGSGTVTSVSVVSANGLAGTVATATTTPAITLSTTVNGMVKGNGTALSAATAGTDYSAGTSALATGILKSTTSTGALSIAVAGDFPVLNQNTTGSAATLTTSRNIYGNPFNGSADLTQVIASTFGGTGNGFTRFTGPATSEKTFTLPNASATILTTNAAVTVGQGGTGLTALGTANQQLRVNAGGTALEYFTPSAGGSGTVTNFNFTNQNGFTGTVTNATTTPTLALSTSLNGLLRGNGTALVTGQANLASEVTGTLPVANGGTGFTTITTGDLLYGSATNVISKLPAGTAGRVLTMGSTGAPEWAIASGGGAVSSVFGRTGAVVAQTGDYTFAQIGSKPTTLSGYGITDAIQNGTAVQSGANFNISGNGTIGSKLTVKGSLLELGSLVQTGPVTMNFLQQWNASGNGWYLGYTSSTSNDFALQGLENSGAFRLSTNSAERMTVLANGNVGIGVTSPGEKLQIVAGGNIQLDNGYLMQRQNSRSRYYNTANSNYAEIYNPSASGSSELAFINGGTEAMRITSDGSVAIGIATVPVNYKFAVKGNIIAEKVRVKLHNTGWPDYVFHPNYNLPTLKETEQFIKANNHLPGVPSAKQIEKEGLDLGDGQAVLLKKIEEMTLHLIEMNKRLEKLEAENEMLKKKQQ